MLIHVSRVLTYIIHRYRHFGETWGSSKCQTQCLVPQVSRESQSFPRFDIRGRQSLVLGKLLTVKVKADVCHHTKRLGKYESAV